LAACLLLSRFVTTLIGEGEIGRYLNEGLVILAACRT